MSESLFIPNSYQTPNAYVDRLMSLLSPEEWVVLSYAARRIFGFQKRSDRIALSQFTDGTRGAGGKVLDHGTGLSKPTVIKSVRALQDFGVLVFVAGNNPATNKGAEYSLQLDSELVDWAGLAARKAGARVKDQAKMAKAREALPAHGAQDEAPGANEAQDVSAVNDIDRVSAVNGIDKARSMALTTPGKCHLPAPVNGIDTQNTVNNQLKPEENQTRAPELERPEIRAKARVKAIIDNLVSSDQPAYDLGDYPEDVRSILGAFLDLWPLDVPAKGRGGAFAEWIKEGRYLRDACAEFGPQALRAAFDKWESDRQAGRAFTVARPGAMIATVKAKVGELRLDQTKAPAPVDLGDHLQAKEAKRLEAAKIIEQAKLRQAGVGALRGV